MNLRDLEEDNRSSQYDALVNRMRRIKFTDDDNKGTVVERLYDAKPLPEQWKEMDEEEDKNNNAYNGGNDK